jgi:hypothetical protein
VKHTQGVFSSRDRLAEIFISGKGPFGFFGLAGGVFVYIYIYIYIYIYVYIYMYIYMYMYMYIHMQKCIYMYFRIYVYVCLLAEIFISGKGPFGLFGFAGTFYMHKNIHVPVFLYRHIFMIFSINLYVLFIHIPVCTAVRSLYGARVTPLSLNQNRFPGRE